MIGLLRPVAVGLVVALMADFAAAQGFTNPAPAPPPIRVVGPRGVVPGVVYPAASPFTPPYAYNGIGGGMNRPYPGYLPYYGGFGYAPFAYGYPYGNSSYYGYGNITGGYVARNFGPSPFNPPPIVDPQLEGAGGADGRLSVTLSGLQSAQLTVALPTSGELWVDGKKEKDSATSFTATSATLRPGESHDFVVRAEWTVKGTRYRADRTVRVAGGDRQKLTLILGDPVKD